MIFRGERSVGVTLLDPQIIGRDPDPVFRMVSPKVWTRLQCSRKTASKHLQAYAHDHSHQVVAYLSRPLNSRPVVLTKIQSNLCGVLI